MSIYNEISKEMHPMMSAFMEDPETRKIMLEAVGDAQKVLEQRARKNMKPTVECRHSGETPQFDTLVEAIKYATVKRITGRIVTSYDTFELKDGVGPKKRFSKKRLLAVLKDLGFIEKDEQVGYEAYGRDVQAYINVKSLQDRQALESILRLLGQSVNDNYAPGSKVVNVGVTYFKAWHWDE